MQTNQAGGHVTKLGVTVRCHEADKEKADLVVVGTEGRGGAGNWPLGSVSPRLLHIARRPVAVVRVASPKTR